MKKLLIAFLCMGMFVISGCSGKTSEKEVKEVVTTFLDTVKSGDMDKIDKLGVDGATLSFDKLDSASYAKNFLSNVLKTMTYEIKSVDIKEDKTATVTVDITNHQVGKFLSNAEMLQKIITDTMKDSSDDMTSEKYMEKYFENLVKEYDKNKPETKTTTIEIVLNKNSDNKWIIQNNSDLGNAFLGDILSSYKDLNNVLENLK